MLFLCKLNYDFTPLLSVFLLGLTANVYTLFTV